MSRASDALRRIRVTETSRPLAMKCETELRCTPRQRRLLGDLGYEFRPGSCFYVPEDQEAIIRGTA